MGSAVEEAPSFPALVMSLESHLIISLKLHHRECSLFYTDSHDANGFFCFLGIVHIGSSFVIMVSYLHRHSFLSFSFLIPR